MLELIFGGGFGLVSSVAGWVNDHYEAKRKLEAAAQERDHELRMAEINHQYEREMLDQRTTAELSLGAQQASIAAESAESDYRRAALDQETQFSNNSIVKDESRLASWVLNFGYIANVFRGLARTSVIYITLVMALYVVIFEVSPPVLLFVESMLTLVAGFLFGRVGASTLAASLSKKKASP